MLSLVLVSWTILAFPAGEVLGNESVDQCSPDAPAANKIRDKVATLQNLVESYICKSAKVEEKTEIVRESVTTIQPTGGACKADFEPSVKRNKRIIVCALRSEDINAQFTMKSVDEKLCTHVLLVGYFKVHAKTAVIKENKLDTHTLSALLAVLKSKKLKVWLSIGSDGTLKPEEYSFIANSDILRAKFVQNVMDIISTNGFDGFSPRWKYPACPGNVCFKLIKVDFVNYVSLMEALSLMLRPKGLSLAAYGTNWLMLKTMFDFASLKKFVDFWLIPCFNNMGHWSTSTGIASGQKFFEDCIGYYFPAIPVETALIGISISYNPVKLANANANSLNIMIRKDVIGNPNLKSFRSVCTAVNTLDGKLVYNETEKLNVYYTNDTDWVSGESTISVRQKMELINKLNFPGVYVEHVSDDDFDGKECRCGAFPILRTINEAVRGDGGCVVPMCPVSKAVGNSTKQQK